LEREALLLPAVVEAAHDLVARHLDDDDALAGETLQYDIPALRRLGHGVLREAMREGCCLVPSTCARQEASAGPPVQAADPGRESGHGALVDQPVERRGAGIVRGDGARGARAHPRARLAGLPRLAAVPLHRA